MLGLNIGKWKDTCLKHVRGKLQVSASRSHSFSERKFALIHPCDSYTSLLIQVGNLLAFPLLLRGSHHKMKAAFFFSCAWVLRGGSSKSFMAKKQNRQKEVFNALLYLVNCTRIRITMSIRIS